MVCFGVAIGLMIAFVREQTGLPSDTVIGVFFAAAIGLGAIFTKLASGKKFFSIEDFIFGNPTVAEGWQVVLLMGLAGMVGIFLWYMFNWLMLTSASPSLALSRRVPVQLCRYLFIVLLALMVNLSQQITGTLLINGLLIVPAAAAANVARNLRQMFWYSVAIALLVGASGNLLSWEISCSFQRHFSVGISGTIVVLCTLVFALSIPLGRWLRNRQESRSRLAFVAQSNDNKRSG
jgi:zinc transport system permease protein